MLYITIKSSISVYIIILSNYGGILFGYSKYIRPTYSVLRSSVNIQGYDDNAICNKAKCTYKTHTAYNIANSKCGNYYACKECPISPGNSICYLGITSPLSVNIGEGEVYVSHKESKYINETSDNGANAGNKDDDEDEDDNISLIQKNIDVFSFEFKENVTKSEFMDRKRVCSVNQDGTTELSIRLIMQWYRDPITSSDTANVSMQTSMLEVGSTSPFDDDDDTSSDYGDKSGVSKMRRRIEFLKKVFNKANDVHNRVAPVITKPKLHIQFVVDHPSISHCRSPLLWKGTLQKKSLIYVGNQNFAIKAKELDIELLKKSIKVNVTTKSLVKLKYSSCIQIHCVKRLSNLRNPIYSTNYSLKPTYNKVSQNFNGINYIPPVPRVYNHNYNSIAAIQPLTTTYSGIVMKSFLLYYISIIVILSLINF